MVEPMMANAVLPNGARYYVDHAHPEYSTPECASPGQAVLHDRAGELVIEESMQRARLRLPEGAELIAYKNNSDGKGNSYGCHENYLVPREVPFGRIQGAMLAHFVSRQVFCGAGKVGVEVPRQGENRPMFQLSQRADFFEEEVGLETTIRRPIVNTRDEPHANPALYRRLHVIAGDANMSEVATWLKLGTTALVLSCLEDDEFGTGLGPVDPVSAVRAVSHDITLRAAYECLDGSMRTALAVQEEILARVTSWFGRQDVDPLGGEGPGVLAEWSRTLELLGSDPSRTADTVDWVAKLRIIEGFADRHGADWDDARLRAVDLQYHDMRPGRGLARRAKLRRLVPDAAADAARNEPPSGTRAYFRGACLARWPDKVVSASWDGIVLDTAAGLVRLPMDEPLKGTKDLVGRLLSAATDVDHLVEMLGSSAVVPVESDPGW
jgi:proteasome accessory factor A